MHPRLADELRGLTPEEQVEHLLSILSPPEHPSALMMDAHGADLTPMEGMVLYALSVSRLTLVPGQSLLQAVYGYAFFAENSVGTVIKHARRAIESNDLPLLIHTRNSLGYRIEVIDPAFRWPWPTPQKTKLKG